MNKYILNEEKNAKSVREEGLDKFYTIPSYAKKCIEQVFDLYDKYSFDLIIEPSAGNGSFFNQLDYENKLGIDIAPETENIVKMDFFDYTPHTTEKILVIGNPPFGRVSSNAIKFFNHAAKCATVIAFIVPRTFRRPSVQNKLDSHFHLVYDVDVPTKPCCFTPPMVAKCCFQIWEKKEVQRLTVELPTKHDDWEFLAFGPLDDNGQPTPPVGADFAMRAYGGKIGVIEKNNLETLRPKSWHWIKCNIDKNILIERFSQLDYSDSLNTARQNSMGRGELVRLYTNFVNSKF
jgi:predicted RNA methylase